MTAKEMQQQYLDSLNVKPKPIQDDDKLMPVGYIEHIRRQSSELTRLLNREMGIKYIRESLSEWPERLEAELKYYEENVKA